MTHETNGHRAEADDKLSRLRAQLPAATATGYFNAGTNGPLSTVVQQALIDAATEELQRGRIGSDYYASIQDAARSTRTAIAGLFGADPGEIALMRSTTEGLNVALMGVEWRRGDEVITTQLEHICLFSVLGLLSHRHGVIVKTIDIGDGGGDVVAALAAAMSPRTRAVAISHVQWSTGAVLPLAEIGALCHPRGVLVIVDAAQAVGQIAVDVAALGVDAYAMAGQKWLGGPGGTGALFVRRDRMGEIRPTYLRAGAFDSFGFVVPPDSAARYEMGEMYNPLVRAQMAGLTWLRDEVGFAWLTARNADLGRRCRDGLGAVDGVNVATPVHRMAGLVCFSIDGMAPKPVSDALLDRGYTIRYVDQRPGPALARVSTGWWCTEEEVDGLVEAVAGIAAGVIAAAAR